jgi:DNA-binding transcriptional LysR family regulator
MFLTPAGATPASVQFLQVTEAIIELVKADMGVSALARWMVLPHITSGAVRPFDGPRGLQRDCRIGFRRSDPRAQQLTKASMSLSRSLTHNLRSFS